MSLDVSNVLDDFIKHKTVEEYLQDVSYLDDFNYVPSDFALEFVNFIKLINGGEGEENKTPPLHYKMLDQLSNIGNFGRIASMIHRGAAKTTIFGEYLFLYLAINGGRLPGFGVIESALYVSDSIDNGVKNMRKNLEFRWENSEFLQKYIPKIQFTDIEWKFTNLNGETFIVKGYGAKTGVRGTKSQGKRPKLAVLDDLVSDTDARSPTVIAAIEDTVNKAIEFAVHTEKSIVLWNGTPFNASDPLYKAIESGAWTVNVYPVCETFPCTREEFRGSWADRFTYDYVLSAYSRAKMQGKVEAFNQELMLKIMSDDDRLVEDADIRWYSRKSLLKNKSNFNFYITTDFATSEKQSADFSFISVWALNSAGDWFWVDGMCERQTLDKSIDKLFHLVSKYGPQSVGVEVSGQQAGFIPWITDQMMTRNIWFTLASSNNSNKPGIMPNTDKFKRFSVMVPMFKAGKMYFPQEAENEKPIVEMMEELRLASHSGFKSKKDDAIDTVSMLGLLKTWRPSEIASFKENSANIYDIGEEKTVYDSSYLV